MFTQADLTVLASYCHLIAQGLQYPDVKPHKVRDVHAMQIQNMGNKARTDRITPAFQPKAMPRRPVFWYVPLPLSTQCLSL